MNKKLLFLLPVALALIFGLAVIAAKKQGSSLRGEEGKTVSVASLLNQAQESEAGGDLLAAKGIYQELVNNFPAHQEVAGWQKKMEEINLKLLFSSALIPGKSIVYEVKPADTLSKIARELNTTVDLIIKSNNLSTDKINPGKKIRIWNEPFNILVDKSQNTLMLKTGSEEIIKTYTVSTGANNSTPAGTFKIVDKIPNPPWFKPGSEKPIPAGSPENILGTRWLALSLPSYGIHGTTDPQSLGKQVTQGCVRMSNSDVEELYTIVPVGTEVTIID